MAIRHDPQRIIYCPFRGTHGKGMMLQASVRIAGPRAKLAEVLDVLQCLKGPTEVSEGSRMCRVFPDVEDEHTLTHLVQWDTPDEREEHFRSERFRRLLPYVELSLEPPEVEVSALAQIGGIEFFVAAIGSQSHS